jgi:putative aldouronate transport system substrate-binding protein
MKKVIMFMLALSMVLAFSAYGGGNRDKGGAGSYIDDGALYELHVVLPVSGTVQKDIKEVEAQISALVKEKINATVKITQISYSNWTQQTNLMLAAGEKIDVIWLSTNYGYNSVVTRGQVIPLDDLLKEHGQGVANVLGGRYLDPCRVGGLVYGVPSTRDMAQRYGAYLKKDLVDKYNINTNSITSPETLANAMQIVREKEPDVLPLVITQNMTSVEYLYAPVFDTLSDRFGVLRMSDNNFKVLNLYETPEYVSAVNLMYDWYQKGYVTRDAANTQDQPRDLFRADRGFAYLANYKPGQEGQEFRITGKEIVCVFFAPTITTTAQITNMMAGIPITSKNPARAMKLLNLWYTDPDLINLYDNGIEGRHYVKQSDGSIWYPGGVDPSSTGYSPTAYFIGNNYLARVWRGDPLDLYSQMEAWNLAAQVSPAMGFSFDQDPVNTEVAAVQNVVSQYRKSLENGASDPAIVLPEYQAKLKAAGLEKIIAEKQKQLDEWVKANKK